MRSWELKVTPCADGPNKLILSMQRGGGGGGERFMCAFPSMCPSKADFLPASVPSSCFSIPVVVEQGYAIKSQNLNAKLKLFRFAVCAQSSFLPWHLFI